MELNRNTMRKLIFLIVLVFLLFACAQNAGFIAMELRLLVGILSPFLVGGAIAFILNVPMHFLENKPLRRLQDSKYLKKLARPVSLLLTLVLVVLVILILMLVIIPQLGESLESLGLAIQAAIPRFVNWAEDLFANNPQIAEWINSQLENLTFDWNTLLNRAAELLKSSVGGVLNITISTVRSVVSGVASFFIAFVFACYILLQKEKLGRNFRKALYALFPRKAAEKVMSVASLSYRIFASFITGQCIEAVILGTMFFVVLSLLKIPYALLIGCLIAVTALIPIVGAFIGCAVGAFLLLMVSPAKALLFIVLFLVLQQIEGNLIYPHVVGSSVGLPSIWVLMAVTVGGSLMGVAGMLLFIPLTSVAYTLFRDFVNRRLRERNIRVK